MSGSSSSRGVGGSAASGAGVIRPPHEEEEGEDGEEEPLHSENEEGDSPFPFATFDTLVELVTNNPECAKLKDKDGALLLHSACEKNAPFPVISLLLSAYPEAAREKYSTQPLLPLAISCNN